MVVNIYTIKALCDGIINLFKIFLMQFVRLSFLGFTSELLAHLLLITSVFYGCFLKGFVVVVPHHCSAQCYLMVEYCLRLEAFVS